MLLMSNERCNDALDEKLRKEVNFYNQVIFVMRFQMYYFLLNIRGLFKKYENIVKVERFHAVPLNCLTETQNFRESDLLPLQKHFHCHAFLVHNNTNKYKSLLLLFNCDLFDCINFHEYDVLIYTTIKSKTSELCLKVVLLYRENNVSRINYLQYMEWIIARHNPNVVLGDFNEDFLK